MTLVSDPRGVLAPQLWVQFRVPAPKAWETGPRHGALELECGQQERWAAMAETGEVGLSLGRS